MELRSLRELYIHELRDLYDLQVKLGGVACQGMGGLVEEGRWFWTAGGEAHVRDAGLIGAARRMLHYLIAAYGCGRTFAQLLDQDQAADALQECLNNAVELDRMLTRLARESINVAAAAVQGRRRATMPPCRSSTSRATS